MFLLVRVEVLFEEMVSCTAVPSTVTLCAAEDVLSDEIFSRDPALSSQCVHMCT